MSTVTLTAGFAYKGGIYAPTYNTALGVSLYQAFRCALTSTAGQAYEGTLTLAPSATQTLNLASGLTNPLGEAIVFAHVYALLINHNSASLATAGISVFGGASNDFQFGLSALATWTGLPGYATAFVINETKTGKVVDGTHKNILFTNLDATALHTATVNVAIFGTTT